MSIASWTGANHHAGSLEIFPFCQIGNAVSHVYGHVCQGKEVTTLDMGPALWAFSMRFCENRGEHGEYRVTEKYCTL